MKVTKRFHVLRSKDLHGVFEIENLIFTWRNVVRQQLRSLDILDLYDYYDFNFNIEDKANSIQKKILEGQYRITQPLIYRLEKKYGVCRHILLLSPSDALVLQTIVDMGLAKQLLEAQPTTRSYYSRDSQNPKKAPDSWNGEGEYGWRKKWKKFQKEIWNFSVQKKYTVVTDLANYYENIGIRELRHTISSHASVSEVILDLLFNMLEQMSWLPDYLPTSLKGLPVIDLEAPRLLAHALLYEIDEILEESTNGCFVRWIDDINFGVESFDEACITLGDTNDVLKSRGLSLNLGKTDIYTPEQVAMHFMIDTHKYLNGIEQSLSSDKNEDFRLDTDKIENELFNCYLDVKEKKHLKQWDKSIKRFLNIFGKLGSELLLEDAKDFFVNRPNIRKNAIYYLKALGYRKSTAKIVQSILMEARIYDDATLFYVVKLLTDWQIGVSDEDVSYVKMISSVIGSLNDNPMTYYCLIWFAAKYFNPDEVIDLITRNEFIWKHDRFLRRQVTSITPRYIYYSYDFAIDFLKKEVSDGMEDSASVASSINLIRELDEIPFKLNSYLFPVRNQKIYPLPKYLILLAFLGSNAFKSKRSFFHNKMNKILSDPWYVNWITTCIS